MYDEFSLNSSSESDSSCYFFGLFMQYVCPEWAKFWIKAGFSFPAFADFTVRSKIGAINASEALEEISLDEFDSAKNCEFWLLNAAKRDSNFGKIMSPKYSKTYRPIAIGFNMSGNYTIIILSRWRNWLYTLKKMGKWTKWQFCI